MNYDSDYEVRLAILERMGGDVTKTYDSVYEIDLAILELTEGGGGGGGEGAQINDNIISAGYAWSSRKIDSEMTSRLQNALSGVVSDSELQTILASYPTKTEVASDLAGKQDALTAGDNITISNGVISAQVPDVSNLASKSELSTGLAGKQNTLTAGTGIQIANDVISAISEINDLAASSSSTYSSTKITELIAGLGFSVEVVETLPSDGDERTIYLVPKVDTELEDIYDEYIFVNDNWERIGNTAIDLSQYYTKTETDTLLNGKQDTLTAGSNIQINNGVISATDTTYTAGSNITIENGVISATGGSNLSAGTNISITNNQINALGYARKASGSEAGAGLQANNTREFAVGTYNTIGIYSDSYRRPVFTVGVGNPLTQIRENGLVVGETGNVYIKGIGGYTGTNPTTANTLQKAIDGKVGSSTVLTLWSGTQAEYDAITTKDANTLYVVTE